MFIDRLHFSIHDPLLRMTFFVLADWFAGNNGKYFVQQILLHTVFKAGDGSFTLQGSKSLSFNSSSNSFSRANHSTTAQWSAADLVDYGRYAFHQIFCTISGHESSCRLADVAGIAGTVTNSQSGSSSIDSVAAKTGEQIFNWLSDVPRERFPPPSASAQTSSANWIKYGLSLFQDASPLNSGLSTQNGMLRYWTELSANVLQLSFFWLTLIFKPYFLIAILWVVEEFLVACCVTYINLLAIQHGNSGLLISVACLVNIAVVRVLQVPAEFDRQSYADVMRNSVGTEKSRFFALILDAHRKLSRWYTPTRRRTMCYHVTSALPLLRLVMMDVLHLPPSIAYSVLICAIPFTGIGHMWSRFTLHLISCVCGVVLYFIQRAVYNVAALCDVGSNNEDSSRFGPERVVSFISHLGFNDYSMVLWLHAAAYYWVAKVALLITMKHVAPRFVDFSDAENRRDILQLGTITEENLLNRTIPLIMRTTISSYAALLGLAELIRQALTTTGSNGLLGIWRKAFGICSAADTSARRRLELLKAAHANFLLLFMHAYLMPSSTIIEPTYNDSIETQQFVKQREFMLTNLFASTLIFYVLWHIQRQLPSLAFNTTRQILIESWEKQHLCRQNSLLPSNPSTTTEKEGDEDTETKTFSAKALKSVSHQQVAATKAVRVKLLKLLFGGLVLPGCVLLICQPIITAQMLRTTAIHQRSMSSKNKSTLLLTSFYWYVYLQTFVWLLDIFVQIVLTCANITVFQRHMEQSFDALLTNDGKNIRAKRHHIRLLCISVLRQLWQRFGIYLCSMTIVGLSGALLVFSVHPFQWTTYEYVVSMYILIRFLSSCNQLTKNILRGVTAE